MNEDVSPKYLMGLIASIEPVIWAEFESYKNVGFYIEKWHECDDFNWENFSIILRKDGGIDLQSTLHSMNSNILLKIAVDLGVETPDFIPSVATFRNEIKSDYKTASATFEKAFKQIETHPDIAVGLANSALESIIKEIFKDSRIEIQPKEGKTLYDLAGELLKVFQFYPNSDIPSEIKTIGSSLLAVNKSIEQLRSTKTGFHGKTDTDYVINDALYTYFIVNSVTTVGLFLNSFYRNKFPKLNIAQPVSNSDDLPF